MKFKYMALLLLLVAALTACGDVASSSAQDLAAPQPETFGAAEMDSAPEQMAETTTAQAVSPATQETAEPSAFTELDQRAVLCALISEAVDGYTYDPFSSGFFWRAVGYLASVAEDATGAAIEDGQVELTEEQVKPLAAALFGPYDGQYPSLSEEDPLVAQEYVDGAYRYTVTSMGPLNYTVDLTQPEPQGDGTYLCEAELTPVWQSQEPDGQDSSYDAVLGRYVVTLTDYAGEGDAFSYSITGVQAK